MRLLNSIIFAVFIMFSTMFAQDSVKVAKQDLIEFRETIESLETTNQMLWNTQKGYEESIKLYNQEIGELRMAIEADSTIVNLHEQKFELQTEKIEIYKNAWKLYLSKFLQLYM